MFEKLIPLLLGAEKIGIFTHENPDGDAMGSAYSLKLAMLSIGKLAEVFLVPEPDRAAYKLIRDKKVELTVEECDLLVAVDCADVHRLGEYTELFLAHQNTAAIDHHITHVPFSKVTVVRDLSSCSELLEGLYQRMNMEITVDIANDLYLGMACDTGSFKYAGVTPDTMRAAARLMECGAEFSLISKKVFDTKTREYYQLMQTALERLKFYDNGKISALYLSKEDFKNAGIDESRAGGIVTIPSSISGVEVGIYIRDREDGEYKVSLRSGEMVDVATIAASFGGGGHVRASGYSVSGKQVSELIEDALAEIRKQLKEDN